MGLLCFFWLVLLLIVELGRVVEFIGVEVVVFPLLLLILVIGVVGAVVSTLGNEDE